MPGDVVNLRARRKAKARAERDRQATENRAKFGRSKSETRLGEMTRALDRRRLEGARRVDEPTEDEGR
jgi:hypothetical protein